MGGSSRLLTHNSANNCFGADFSAPFLFPTLNITDEIKVDTNGKIVAAVDGGKYGARRRSANFVPQEAAASTRSAAELRKTRRQYGRELPLRHFRHCAATICEVGAAKAVQSRKCKVNTKAKA
jgi:hypothetical protein